MNQFNCEHCGYKSKTKRDLDGKRVRCPSCGRTFRVGQTAAPLPISEINIAKSERVQNRVERQQTSRFNLNAMLDSLDSHSTTRKILFSAWGIYAVVFACILAFSWCFNWRGIRYVSYSRMPVFILGQLFLLASYVAFVFVVWCRRATSAAKDHASNQFVVVPIVADFLLASCEAISAVLLILAIPATLILPFNNAGILNAYLEIGEIENSIFRFLLNSLTNLLTCIGLAVAIFIFGKLLSEMLNILFSIGNDVTQLVHTNISQGESTQEPNDSTEDAR